MNVTSPAPEASAAPLRNGLRFEGSGSEYFKIWIVNLALTIVTLGIFSAWAKVRSRRYLYGNTFLAGHNFDYHASPLRILIGRVISLFLLVGYGATANFAPRAMFIWGIVFVLALPWLVQASLRFNARNTSYRNVRFSFTGTYGGAFGAYVLWSILLGLTLFTTLPLARRARDYYVINNHSFGGQSFHADIPGRAMYVIFLQTLGMFIALVLCSSLVYLGVRKAPVDFMHPLSMGPFFLIPAAIFAFCLLFIVTFLSTNIFNLAISRTTLASQYQLEARLAPLRMTGIIFSNLILTLLTLGLFYPWAAVRIARYRAEHIGVIGPADFDNFTSELAAGPGAIGEEIASFFDIDIGL